jgi:hypothetical protein
MRVNKVVVATWLALGIAAQGSAGAEERRARVSGVGRVSLVDGNGTPLPRVKHDGKTYVIGQRGQAFGVKVKNSSRGRAEFVISVDGRDVMNGQPATKEARGYVLEGKQSTVIQGWRTSQSKVAKFEFSKRGDGYDSQMGGEGRREGLVGVAIFDERPRPVYRPMRPDLLGGAAGMRRSSRAGTASLSLEGTRDLSTDFGDEIEDRVSSTTFIRASAEPRAVLQLSYGTAKALIKSGVPKSIVDRALRLGSAETDDDDDEEGAFTDDRSSGGFAPRPPGRRGRSG